MARDRGLVVDHADGDASATETPDDAEALIIPSEHDGAHLRSAAEARTAVATGRPRTGMLDESHSSRYVVKHLRRHKATPTKQFAAIFRPRRNAVEIEDDSTT
jgi:hypothetical protein